MAKQYAEIIAFPTKQAEVLAFPIVACGCGCGYLLDKKEHALIICEENNKCYADEEHFLTGEKVVELNGRYYFLDDSYDHPHIYTKSELFQELGVYWINALVPIA